MSLEIDITHSIVAFRSTLNELKKSAIVSATRKSLNRTAITMRKISVKNIEDQYNGLKPAEIKSRYLKIRKAKGSNLNTMQSSILFSDRPIGMIKMVVGSKRPRAQKGRKVSKRTPISVRVKGKKFTMKRAFIARVRSGDSETTHVFQRRRGKLAKQTLPSVGLMLDKEGKLKKIAREGQKMFDKTLRQDLNFRINKLRAKLERAALRS